MNDQLTEEQISNYKEAFSLFDKDGDSVIDTKYLGLLVQSLNLNPTQSEIKQMTEEVDPDNMNQVTFPDFIALMAKWAKDSDPEEELMEAFKELDKDKLEYLETNQFKNAMSHLAEAFTDKEIENLIKDADPNNTGKIYYAEFIKMIISSYQN